ncbi:hypothetical protein K505DRAFT_325420 [Melanomma pulvis-pyrius CBS 109.77]|uniref:Uncharacterized protein n=1 Tax=Melanomma pulvis-pyrius CBS 109.77 TaxID=1314802 RepID=A0A6A6XAR3_9PLEO|nr:hypothetical protein K505DRAFT_325420 [Melanomma pulvis-pyrius CBS 109.77]
MPLVPIAPSAANLSPSQYPSPILPCCPSFDAEGRPTPLVGRPSSMPAVCYQPSAPISSNLALGGPTGQ